MTKTPEELKRDQQMMEQLDTQEMSSLFNMTPQSSRPASNPLPQGSLQGTMTQPQPQKQANISEFSAVMRAISESAYDYRQGKETKDLGFDPSKVSGSIFKQVMNQLESARGSDISKIYGSAVEAAKFDIEEKEKQRQFDVEQSNKKFELIKQKTELGIDSVYIPTGTLADRNNNPGNLKYVGQAGATMGEGGFAKFNSPEDGYQALIDQVRLDQSRGLTLAQFVNKYAPPTENNTSLYVQQMSQWMGVDPNVQLSALDYEQVAEMVARKESGTQMVRATASEGQPEIKSWTDLKAAEEIKAKEGESLAAKETAKTDFINKISNIDTALNDTEGLSAAVGTNWLGRLPTPFSGERQRFISEVEQIVSTDALNALIKAKAQGATFGALSDTEMEILRSSATKIGSWAIKDKKGKTTGYNVDEGTFKKELETLKKYTRQALSSIDPTIGEIREVNGVRYKKVEGGWETL